MIEEWRPTYIYGNRYEVSNLGRVRSFSPAGHSIEKKKIPLIKKTFINNSGYECISLKRKGIKKTVTVHRLVLLAFIGQYKNKEADHINKIRTDNRLSNLRWVTRKENLSTRICHRGEEHVGSKLKTRDIYEILSLIKQKKSQTEIAKKFLISQAQITRIKQGARWNWLTGLK